MTRTGDPLDRRGYEQAFDDGFERGALDPGRWLPHHLPQWSGRAQSAARYDLTGGVLRLRVDADQPPWCPEWDGDVRVSNLQTGVRSGPVGSPDGQHRFRPEVRVREEQPEQWLYTPRRGLVEARLRAPDDPHAMVALWMIGIEDRPEHSAEICVAEVFGSEVGPDASLVGMGVHPFGDPSLTDDFEKVSVPVDAREPHLYSAQWTDDGVAFFVDERCVKVVDQSPTYPMQLMLGLYAFSPPRDRAHAPVAAEVHTVRGYSRRP